MVDDFISNIQERKIDEVGRKNSVKIHVDKRAPEIVLTGDSEDIASALPDVYAILYEIKDLEAKKKAAELMAKQVIWQVSDTTGKFKAYSKKTNVIIEEAYVAKKSMVEWTDKRGKHKLTFNSMEDETGGKKTSVRRIEPGKISLPSRWTSMTANATTLYICVPVSSSSDEYTKLVASLQATSGGGAQTIIKVERIQNPSLYRQYMQRKLDMDTANGTNPSNERRLWHGTAGNNVDKINGKGFNRSYCGQHGVAIGNGVYFATNSSYSIRGYTSPDAKGHRHIYQARVLTGKYVTGQGGLKEPPVLPGSTVATYDSVTDNPAAPGMFVVFFDAQTYPEYLITFQ